MNVERRAEEFLVDFLPVIDAFSAYFAAPTWRVRTVAFNLVDRAATSENGRYVLTGASHPIIMRGKEEDFSRRLRTLESDAFMLKQKHCLEVQNAYVVAPRGDGVRYVPAVKIALENNSVLTTIGPRYIKVFFEKQPLLPAQPLHAEHAGLLGKTDGQGHCLHLSPVTLDAVFEFNGKRIVSMNASHHAGVYQLNSPIKMDREYLKPVADGIQQHLTSLLHMMQ